MSSFSHMYISKLHQKGELKTHSSKLGVWKQEMIQIFEPWVSLGEKKKSGNNKRGEFSLVWDQGVI